MTSGGVESRYIKQNRTPGSYWNENRYPTARRDGNVPYVEASVCKRCLTASDWSLEYLDTDVTAWSSKLP